MKVTYFNAGGRADQVRCVFLFAGKEFTDERLTGEDFGKKKMNGDFPFGSVPMLTDGDFHLAQGVACVQYASQVCGLWPTDIKEAAHALSLALYGEDARMKFYTWYFCKDDTKDAKKIELDTYNAAFQKNLLKHLNGKLFFGGDKVNGADLALFTVFVGAIKLAGLHVEKELDEWVERIFAKSDAIAKYYKKE
jgi:glutathione S-transferase